jgi:hypothetical protein
MNATNTWFSLWRAFFRTAAAAAFVCLLPLAHASTRWATLEAIHQLENPTDSPRPGPYGELGAYQFRAAVWHKYTHIPFSRALDRATSDQIAVMHYEYLKRELAKAGIEPSTYNIALCWNGGLGGAKHATAPHCARDYATRAETLAQQYDRISLASRVAVN